MKMRVDILANSYFLNLYNFDKPEDKIVVK
jgi:hypothetical protein